MRHQQLFASNIDITPHQNTMENCPFLQRLPVEIRLRVYELLLCFKGPIKLRQVIPGSRDLCILRVNQQIRNEALPVSNERVEEMSI